MCMQRSRAQVCCHRPEPEEGCHLQMRLEQTKQKP